MKRWVEHYLANLNAQSFPKHPGFECGRCDYILECREGREHIISRPWDLAADLPAVELVPNLIRIQKNPQRRLKLEMPRVKQVSPKIPPPQPKPVVVLVPWEEPSEVTAP